MLKEGLGWGDWNKPLHYKRWTTPYFIHHFCIRNIFLIYSYSYFFRLIWSPVYLLNILYYHSLLCSLLFRVISIWPLGTFSGWLSFPLMSHQTFDLSIIYCLYEIFQSPVYFQFPWSTQYFLLPSLETLSDFYFGDEVKKEKKSLSKLFNNLFGNN